MQLRSRKRVFERELAPAANFDVFLPGRLVVAPLDMLYAVIWTDRLVAIATQPHLGGVGVPPVIPPDVETGVSEHRERQRRLDVMKVRRRVSPFRYVPSRARVYLQADLRVPVEHSGSHAIHTRPGRVLGCVDVPICAKRHGRTGDSLIRSIEYLDGGPRTGVLPDRARLHSQRGHVLRWIETIPIATAAGKEHQESASELASFHEWLDLRSMTVYIYMCMNQILLLPFLIPAIAFAAPAATPTPRSAGSAWGALVVNDDTSANEGIGGAAGASWVVLPRVGPGAVSVGPAISASRQSDRWRDGPCNRRLREDILELSADARWVVPFDAKKKVRGFVRTGPGVYRFDYEYQDDNCREYDDSDIDLGWMLGAGAEVALDGGMHFFAAVTGHSSDDDWVALTVGLGFPF